ncbi:MAG: hypothetical protein M5U05_00305 [Anaerolineales bacterium]|nr:hypothetical protein [Anaerolineales bacterium]
MAYTLVLHIMNTDPIVGEAEELPSANATLIIVSNVRRMDGKDVHYVAENTTKVVWPLDRINFIEVMGEEHEEEIIGFVRE